ncbi:MAG: NAD-dependent epimerase/dehydratase family protein [Saprospiraceae bacterium]
MKLPTTKYLVTGASGFIGTSVTMALASRKGVDVHVIARKTSNLWRLDSYRTKIQIHYLDLTDTEAVNAVFTKVQPQHVINCAEPATHTKAAAEFIRQHQQSVAMMTNLLEAVRQFPVQSMVHLGSSMVYKPFTQPATEANEFSPISNKGLIKLTERNLCQFYAHHYQIPIRIARVFRAYGPFEQPKRLLFSLFRANEEQAAIRLSADNVVRNYTYIEDLVNGILLMSNANLTPGEEIILTGNSHHSAKEVAHLIESITQQRFTYHSDHFPPVAADRHYCQVDPTKAKQLLGWEATTSLNQGLRKTYAWWNKHK